MIILFLIEVKTQASWTFVYMATYDHKHCFHFPVQNNIVGKVSINERRKSHPEHQASPYSTPIEVVSRMLRWTSEAKKITLQLVRAAQGYPGKDHRTHFCAIGTQI